MAFSLFLLWTFIIFARPQDFFPFLSPLRPALLLTAVMLFTSLAAGNLRFGEIFNRSSQVRRYYIFYLLMILGIPLAVHSRLTFNYVFMLYPTNLLYFSFFVIYVDSLEKLRKTLYVVGFSALFYAGLSLVSQGLTGGRFGFGSMYDPNDLAYFLISIFPLCFFFFRKEEGLLNRAFAAATIVVSLTVTLLTGSRGGLLGLVAVGFFLFFTRYSPFGFLQKILLMLVLAVALGLNVDKIDTERFATLLNPEEDYNLQSEEGRLAVWKRGWQLTLRNPITGVGAQGFPVAIGGYREEIGEIPRWQAPHNSFVQVLTETGFPGLFVYLLMTFGALKIFFSTAKETQPTSKEYTELALMSRGILLAFVGNLVTTFFLSMAYSTLFALFIALSAVLPSLRHSEQTGGTVTRAQADGSS